MVQKFHDPSDTSVPIEFHTGESSDVLSELHLSPDLVFHDALHTYDIVKTDVALADAMAERPPIHVFDDCYLFADEWTYRPVASAFWYSFDGTPKLGSLLQKVRSFSISKTRFPGVTESVRFIINENTWRSIEVIQDSGHAPITALFPA